MPDPDNTRPQPDAKINGAWFVYAWEWQDCPLALFDDELEARRYADTRHDADCVFWPFGADWSDVQ